MLGRVSNPSRQAIETNIMNDQNDYEHITPQVAVQENGRCILQDGTCNGASTDGTATNISRKQRRSRRDQARQRQLADEQRLLDGRRQQRQQRLQQQQRGDG